MEIYQGRRVRLGQGPARGDVPTWREYYVLSFDFAGADQLAAGTANGRPNSGAYGSKIVNIQDVNFEILKSTYVATDPRVYVRLKDDASGRYLTRGAIDLQAWAGMASTQIGPGAAGSNVMPVIGVAGNPQGPSFLPFIWPQPYVIPGMASITCEALDYSGAANTMRFALHGSKIRPGVAPWDRPISHRIPFTIAIPDDATNPSVAANATVGWAVPIDKDGDFIIQKFTGVRQGAALIQIQDSRDRLWFNSSTGTSVAQHIDNIIGNASFPNIFPSFRFIPRGSTIMVTVQDLSGAANTVRLYAHGWKLLD